MVHLPRGTAFDPDNYLLVAKGRVSKREKQKFGMERFDLYTLNDVEVKAL
jgi:hypothetical protein